MSSYVFGLNYQLDLSWNDARSDKLTTMVAASLTNCHRLHRQSAKVRERNERKTNEKENTRYNNNNKLFAPFEVIDLSTVLLYSFVHVVCMHHDHPFALIIYYSFAWMGTRLWTLEATQSSFLVVVVVVPPGRRLPFNPSDISTRSRSRPFSWTGRPFCLVSFHLHFIFPLYSFSNNLIHWIVFYGTTSN